MTQTQLREKIQKDFFTKFGADKIWMKPSRDNVETVLDIWKFIDEIITLALEEKVKEVEKKILALSRIRGEQPYFWDVTSDTSGLPICAYEDNFRIAGFNEALREAVKALKQ